MNICQNCGRETFTKSWISRKKKYCNNKCQSEYEKKIGLRGNGQPKFISAEELNRLYIGEGKSLSQIGKLLGKSIKQISRYLRAYGIEVRPFSTKGMKISLGMKRTVETKRKIAASKMGDKNPTWKGGVTPEYKRIRQSLEIRLWRDAVLKRDDYTCRMCLKRGGKLEVDHIKSFAHYPALRTSIENGRVLCKPCHRKTPNYAGRVRNLSET